MRSLLLTTVLLGGSALAVASCTESPPDSGCVYSLFDGSLIAGLSTPGCPPDMPVDAWFQWLRGSDLATGTTTTTTTTVAAPGPGPVDTDPVEPTPEPVGSTASSSVPAASTTTTMAATTTTSGGAAPIAFAASGTCVTSPLRVVLSGTGTPGAQISITNADPYQWYYAQPTPPTPVASDGTWQFSMISETPAWLPATLTLAQSTGGTAVVAVSTC